MQAPSKEAAQEFIKSINQKYADKEIVRNPYFHHKKTKTMRNLIINTIYSIRVKSLTRKRKKTKTSRDLPSNLTATRMPNVIQGKLVSFICLFFNLK